MGIKSFNDFTVEQFQQWHKVIKEESDIIDREVKLASILTGKSVEYLESVPYSVLKEVIKRVNKISLTEPSTKVVRFVKVGRKVYSAILNAQDLHGLMSTSQFTAAKTYAANPIENMHLLLPLYYAPYKLFGKQKLAENQIKLAEEFKKVKVGEVYGAVFFYSILWSQFVPILEDSLKQATQVMEEIAADGQGSTSPTAGTLPLNG